MLLADTSRRVCHIRLESKLENPEEREGFRHPDLLAWVRDQRPLLLAAALTILSAYVRNGSPGQRLKAWGSFEGWSGLVRQALVWTGMPDPGATREELARSADREAAGLRSLIQGWREVDPDGDGLTVAKLLEHLEKTPGEYELLRNAVLELCAARAGKLPGTRSLGNKLRHLRGRVVAGKAIDSRDEHGTAVWFVAEVGQVSETAGAATGCSGGSGCSAPARSPASFEQSHAGGDSQDDVGERAQAEQPEQPAGKSDADCDRLLDDESKDGEAVGNASRHCSYCDPRTWREASAEDGRVRTVCSKCGRFIGYRPAKA